MKTISSTSIDQIPFDTTQKIVDEFENEHDIDHLYALVSGGGDSDTVCEVSQELGLDLSGVVHVNTGTGIERTRRYVMERCIDWDLPYHELTGVEDADQKRLTNGFSTHERIHGEDKDYADLESYYYGVRRENDHYEKITKKMGFPGPAYHWVMYLALKHKPIKTFVKDYHNEDETVAFISGVRKKESDRRAKNISDDGISYNWGECPVVSPIAYWSDSDVTSYRRFNDLPSNPVSDILGMSGECLCGCFGSREELEKLKRWGFTDAARKLENLEYEVYNSQVARGYVPEEYALWGHGNIQESKKPENAPQMELCMDCEDSCEPAIIQESENTTIAEAALKKNAHCDMDDRWFFCPDCETIIDDPIAHRKEVHAASPGVPYLGIINWDIREIYHRKPPSADQSVYYTDPKLTKKKRMEKHMSVDPTQNYEFEQTDIPGVSHCTETGQYRISSDAFDSLVANSTDGQPLKNLIDIEPGVLSSIIPHENIDETNIISTLEELQKAVTVDEITELVIENVDPLDQYLSTTPTVERLVADAGLSPLLEKFDVSATDLLNPSYKNTMLKALKKELEDKESDNTKSLPAQYDPMQSSVADFA